MSESNDNEATVVAMCDTCGAGYIWVAEHSKRRCIRHNVKTKVHCPGQIIDIAPVPSSQFPPQKHWSAIVRHSPAAAKEDK